MGLNNYGLQIIASIVIKGLKRNFLIHLMNTAKISITWSTIKKKQIIALGIHSINLCSLREKHYLGRF